MAQSIVNVFSPFLPFLTAILYIFSAFLVFEVIIYFINYLIFRARGLKNNDGYTKFVRPKNPLVEIFWTLPRQMAYDAITSAPGYFRPQGLIIFCGRQGSGKTIAMTEYLIRLKKQYPLSKLMTNYGFTSQDNELADWKQLLNYKNGIYGVIIGMDELQNWFSSLASKDFPPQMLEVITQNRKNRRIILGTSQTFNRLAKPLREQATEVRDCRTFFGCLTLVNRKYAMLDSDGNVKSWTPCGWYFFVHNKEIRESYDTYRIIETLSAKGFYDNPYLSYNSGERRRR